MVTVPVHSVGRLGLNKDLPPHELAPEGWSDGQNVRFENDKVLKAKGHSLSFDPPTVAPYWALYAAGDTDNFWIYAGVNKIYVVNQGGTHTNVTRQTASVDVNYAMNENLLWNGGVLGGIPILNNGVDAPQFWASIAAATKMADLTNWPANTTARVVRPFKNFLVALDITLSSVRSPHKVKWSHGADPGAVPNSWDETDATKDAGEVELTDTARGFLTDGLVLGDIFAIYKQASVWGMQFIGGQFIFRFFPIFSGVGAFSKNCVAQVGARGTPRHFFFTGDDLLVHDGRVYDSIITRKMKAWMVNNFDTDNLGRAFCVTNYPTRECLFCFPQTGSSWPDLCIAWNWTDNTTSIREIKLGSFIAQGNVVETAGAPAQDWNSDSGQWNADAEIWGQVTSNPNEQRLLQCDPVNTQLLHVDTTEQFNGTNMVSFVERQGLALVGKDRQGQPKVDYSIRKLVTRIWPKITGGPVSVAVGTQEDADDAVVWAPTQAFNPASAKYLDFNVNGRLIAVRFETSTDVTWTLDGYDLELVPLGAL